MASFKRPACADKDVLKKSHLGIPLIGKDESACIVAFLADVLRS